MRSGSIEFDVTTSDEGRRVDAFVAASVGCGRARARELLALGAVMLDGRTLEPSDKGRKLAAGQTLTVSARVDDPDHVVPAPELPLEVLGEGEGWIAVAKPAGVAVHPLRAGETGTLLQRLAARRPQVIGIGEGGRRSGVVHRLDVDTSGVQLFATDAPTHRRLRSAFSGHAIDKVYRAVVAGAIDEHGHAEVDLLVGRHRPARVDVYPAGTGPRGSRTCSTRWRRLESFDGACLVEARPRSGFLHQIRATLADQGHPILGDPVYGPDGADRAPRQMLHASALRVGAIDVTAPDPEDFAEALRRLRGT